MGPLLRIGAWGLAATGALALAVFAGRSELGERRFALALANRPKSDSSRLMTTQALTRAAEAEREARRLSDEVQTLTGDRDQLASRVATLERSLADLTGSISLTRPARRPAMVDMLLPPLDGPPAAPAASDPPAAAPPSLPEIASLPSPSSAAFPDARAPRLVPMALRPAEPMAADPARDQTAPPLIPLPQPNPLATNPAMRPPATRPASPAAPARNASADARQRQAQRRVGLDLGGATSVEGLRALWTHIQKSRSSPLIADLKPLISVRDAAQPGSVELRLVAGPVPSALAASRLCAALSASGTACRTAAFVGQALTPR